MDYTARYKKLNTKQKEAVDTIDGPVMVIAGPGTGKTELLSMRAANILKKTDTLPESILCLTFTESGADAMRRRLTSIIGSAAYKVAIHTFHSFGSEIINQNSEFFYRGAEFTAADDIHSYELLNGIFAELNKKDSLAAKLNNEYTYLRDTAACISELKRNGLTPDELRALLDANNHTIEQIDPLLSEVFADRIAKSTIPKLQHTLHAIQKLDTPTYIAGITPLQTLITESLADACESALATGKTTPVTAWKNKWLTKDETGALHLKSHIHQDKLRTCANIYEQYLQRMYQSQLFDFDDMILRVVHAMEVFPALKANLQERFQYIMVDEFQDTNLAQMRILYSLADSPVHNGRPNILVVGDDDQAIYSFQGADVGNIHAFNETFSDTKLIVLTDNYRSVPEVLTHARAVIVKGDDRLETHLPEIDKTLTPHHAPQPNAVRIYELPNIDTERAWLAHTIAKQIKQGVEPATIAVLARRHHELEALLPYLTHENIQVNYERRDNVLDLEPIQCIATIAELLVALYERRHADADGLLPEIIAHPAFGFTPEQLWKLSLKAYESRTLWLQCMETLPEFQPLQVWILSLLQQVAHTPLEQMLDFITGTPDRQADDTFKSPLFEFFFGQQAMQKTPDLYLTHLDALQTIRHKLREYHTNESPTLKSFLDFIQLHRQMNRPITSIRPRSESLLRAITLMTAHKSKGLEYDHVYIIGAVDSTWGERVRSHSRLISYPENLQIAPVGDTFDERLRLFFVAMTRAKKHLTISYSTMDSAGKNLLPASFLSDATTETTHPAVPDTIETLTTHAKTAWYAPVTQVITPSLRELLAPKLDSYKLSSTHLTTFLDVSRGGPQAFLLRNLLRFPQAMQPNAAYGSAIHAALQHAHMHLAATGKQRPHEDILQDFEQSLASQNLTKDNLESFLQKGSDALTAFLAEKYDTFQPHQKAELNFASQSVFLDKAHLTGSLDLVDIKDTQLIVTDYKTGKPTTSWTGKTEYEKIKLHHYKQQLMFYNLLVVHSRDYQKYTFQKGIVQFVEPSQTGAIHALEATFSPQELERFTLLIQRVWERITTLDLPDTAIYEPTYKGILAFEQALIDD